MNNLNRLLVLALFIFVLSSCTNQEEIIKSNKIVTNISPKPTYKKLSDLYKNLDKDILNSNNKTVIIPYLEQKNEEIIDYLVANYPQFSDAANANKKDLSIFYFGLIHALGEENGFSLEFKNRKIPDWARCIIDVLGEYFSIEFIYREYAILFTEGVTWNTAYPVVKNLVRRYAGWFVVAAISYDIATRCV